MSTLDWFVLCFTLVAILVYGIFKSRNQHGARTYLLADKSMPWPVVLLGIMSTQASAITFLSAPGQAYTDGMRFVQYYFGLPLAMIVISVTFIPIFQRLNVYTAYEYLEQRFDRKARLMTAFLFLISRALSTGISIYAPAIILSSIMGWNIYITNILVGGLLIIYTYTGGAKAIAHTQKVQFTIILASMAIAGYLIMDRMPTGVGFEEALYLAGKSGKLNVITTDFDWSDRYNIWSGVIGGFFLALSYFGTDQSQVGRYISGKGVEESRKGLLMNGIVKIPMQFSILLIGALLFAFFSLQPSPPYFNESAYQRFQETMPEKAAALDSRFHEKQALFQTQAMGLIQQKDQVTEQEMEKRLAAFRSTQSEIQDIRKEIQATIKDNGFAPDVTDVNYIFLYFVKRNLPAGLVGLLFAVIFLASWGSISAALNSLASSSLMDIQLVSGTKGISEADQLWWGRLHTLVWGLFCIGVAMFAAQMGSLIEAVNILGSLFYGTLLGIFLVAFYIKSAGARSVILAALVTEGLVILIYSLDIISFLWLNAIGALSVMILAYLFSFIEKMVKLRNA